MFSSAWKAVHTSLASSLRLRVLALTAAIFVAVAVPAWLSFTYVVDATILRLGTLFAEKQVLYDRSRGLEALTREVGLAETVARSPAVIEWARDEADPAKRSRGLAELEHYREAFKDHSYFFVVNGSGNYYFNDAADAYAGTQLRYTLSADNPRDGWYFTTLKRSGCQLNVDHDDVLAVTKVWINCVVEAGGQKLGIIGTGLDLSTFINQVVNSDQQGVESLFVDRTGAVQATRDARKIDFHSLTKKQDAKRTVYQMVDDKTGRARLDDLFAQAHDERANVAADFIRIDGHRMLVGVGYLDKLDWYNVTLMDVDRIIDRSLFLPIGALLFSVMAVAVGLVTWLFKRRVLDRLALAEASLQRVERGDFDLAPADGSGDEIGRLSRALNRMAAAVRDHTGALETAVRERTRQLERIAFVDALSGIANRRGFSESFAQALRRARRTGARHGILLLDIDRFKSINDDHGHHAGDAIVAEAARRVAATLREGDICGRWGGDEFIVLVSDCDKVGLQAAALRVLNAFRHQPIAIGEGAALDLTVSIGGHQIERGESLETAVALADTALYAAKSGGRNRFAISEPQRAAGGFKVA